MFVKTHTQKFFDKNSGGRLLGAVKGITRLIDEPLVGGIISAIAPEVGVGLATAKKLGVLERIKNM